MDRILDQVRIGDMACTPLTVSVPDSEPRRPFLIVSPVLLTEVGFADDAVIHQLVAFLQRLHDAHGAVHAMLPRPR